MSSALGRAARYTIKSYCNSYCFIVYLKSY